MKILGTPTYEQIKYMNDKFKSKLPKIEPRPWKDVFKNKTNDELFIDLVSKLLVYEPSKRLSPYQALLHPYFDDLKNKDAKIPSHLFVFKKCEIDFDKENIEKLLEQIKK